MSRTTNLRKFTLKASAKWAAEKIGKESEWWVLHGVDIKICHLWNIVVVEEDKIGHVP